MKAIGLAILLMTAILMSHAQDAETLFGRQVSDGGYGAPVVKYGVVNGTSALFVGAKGLWIINHVVGIGGGGYGLVSSVDAQGDDPAVKRKITMGYGGLIVECSMDPERLFHLSFDVLIGGGSVRLDKNSGVEVTDADNRFFVIEPGANLDLNVTDYVRLGVGISYRFVGGLDSSLATDSSLSGLSGTFTLKVGAF